MARMTRYRRSSMKARAIKQFGDICVDVLIPGTGIDLAPLTTWCERECGAEWEAWAHAPHSAVEDGRPQSYARFYFSGQEMAESFKNAVSRLLG